MALELMPPGRLAVAYYNEDSTTIEVPITDATVTTWLNATGTEAAGNIADLSLGLDATYANTNTRQNTAGGFSSQKPVLRQGEVTFEMLWNSVTPAANTFEQLIVDASNTLERMSLAFYDYDAQNVASGDTVQGLAGNFFISATKAEDIEDVQRWSVTATVADGAIWHKVTGA